MNYISFCFASLLLKENSELNYELDLVWDKATELGEAFKKSHFNNPNRPLLDCINEYLLDYINA
jgi:hypothetical protein